MSRIADQVREFHEVFHCDIAETPTVGTDPLRVLRYDLIAEEALEFAEAAGVAGDGNHPDLIEMADALGDLAYVVYGAALAFGVNLDAVVDEIHRSNMSKLGADGRPIWRGDGKVLKGPNYFRPNIAAVLGVER